MRLRIVIPARYASSRLPGKPLLDIAGKPMIIRVAEAVLPCRHDGVWIATDHEEIRNVAVRYGFDAVMTRDDHRSGTDRIAEVVMAKGWDDEDIIVNVQGDEPLVDSSLIAAVADALHDHPGAAMATVGHFIDNYDDLFNPNVVKVVCDVTGRALYFSRAPIPWDRDKFLRGDKSGVLPRDSGAQRHIGLYAYRVGFLKHYGQLTPSPLEQQEMLEQLRVLWHGFSIQVVTCTRHPVAGVDTQEDLERVRREFDQRNK